MSCGITKFKLRYNHRIGKCNLSNWKHSRKKFRGFNGIRTHGLCVCAAVLYHLSNEDPYIGNMPVCWVHLNACEEWNMKMLWTEEIQILNKDMIITMVNAIYATANKPPKKLYFRSSHHLHLSFLSRVKMNSDELHSLFIQCVIFILKYSNNLLITGKKF